ncbi:TPA: TniB family NTP-binding protein [Aeromonas sobria]|nr:TniB family NTP-binding protein [Aeromonas sobria]
MNLSSSDAEKLKSFICCYVETPLLRTIKDDFDRLRYDKQFAGEPICMLLTGDTGTGKSSLIRNYMAQSPEQSGHGFIRKSLLLSRIPSKPTLESTMVELLKDLGQWGSEYRLHRSSAEGLTDALIKCLKRCETELIIIDEFQELMENKTREKRNQIANRLKYISETARIPVVLVGMPWAAKIAEEPQWASRLMVRRTIPYFKLSEDAESFVRFVMGLAKRMPFAMQPKLEAQHTIFALFASCKGRIRELKNLLNESVKQALVAHAETLKHEHIAIAFTLFYPDQVNPFLQSINEIQASEVKQYSRYETDATSRDEVLIPLQYTDKVPISQLLKKR